MKKSELKSGMRITLSNGYTYIVVLNTKRGDIIIREDNGWLHLNKYDENLKYLTGDMNFHVKAIFIGPAYITDLFNYSILGDILYNADEPKFRIDTVIRAKDGFTFEVMWRYGNATIIKRIKNIFVNGKVDFAKIYTEEEIDNL